MFKHLNSLIIAVVAVAMSANAQLSYQVAVVETKGGHSFHHMPIIEPGVTDITMLFSWPTDWAYRDDVNQMTPLIASQTLMASGSENYSAREIELLFQEANAYGEITYSRDRVVGEISFPREHTETVLSVVADVMVAPQFDPRWVRRIQRTHASSMEEYLAQPVARLEQFNRRALLGTQPIAHALGYEDVDQVLAVSDADLRQWHRETILQGDPTIVVTGAISQASASNAIDRLLRDLPPATPKVAPTFELNTRPRTILVHDPATPATYVTVHGVQPIHPHGLIWNEIVGALFTYSAASPLFEAMRTELRATYGFAMGTSLINEETNLFFISGEVETAKLADAVAVLRSTYDAFRDNPQMNDFDAIKAYFADVAEEDFYYVDGAAFMILHLIESGIDPRMAPELGDVYRAFTPDDIRQWLDKGFIPSDQLLITAFSNDPNALPGACVVTSLDQVADC